MKKLGLFVTAAAMGAFAGGAMAAPSAKAVYTFAALNLVTEASVECDGYEETCTSADLEAMASSAHSILQASIKMPKHKELLINVSLECGNFLDTHVKSKGGDKNSASAEATVRVLVLVDDGTGYKPALPSGNTGRDLDGDGTNDVFVGMHDGVVFCHRTQELLATFQGIFTTDVNVPGFIGDEDDEFYSNEAACEAGGDGGQTCTAATMVGTCLFEDQFTGKIVADLECFEPEEIQLITASMTANSFTFMYPNTTQSGVHNIAVIAYLDTGAGLGGDEPSGSAIARALIGLGSMSVQTVRMIKGPIVGSTVMDPIELD